MNNYIKEIKAIAIFTLIGIIIFGSIFALSYFKIETYLYQGITYYLILSSFFVIISTFIKSKNLKKITSVILAPAGIFLILGTIILPFGFLFIHVLLYSGFSFIIPELFFKITTFLNIELIKNNSTLIYTKLTSTVFIAVLFNYQLRTLIYKISPARINSSQKLKPYELDKLTNYLLSENNIRFLIYSSYVVLLLIVNFYNFEDKTYSKDLINDKAILQSFVTFIAFERALTLLKQLDFKPSDLLNSIIKSIINKFKDLDKNKPDNPDIQ